MTKNFQIALIILVVLIGIFFFNKNSQSKLETVSEAIFVDDIEPQAIFATTFTIRAARELRSRFLECGDLLMKELVIIVSGQR